ncbi:MAG: Uma2 family endonuclease [Mycobacteriales bacterium]
MTGAAEELAGATFEEFLTHEQAAPRRHELVGGRVYVMAGGSERHDLTAGLIYEALADGARTAGCRPFTSNRLLRAGTAGYYPDVLIVCGPATDRLYEANASLVVEVLSPTTQDTDRREKASAYATLPDLAWYLLADPDRRRLEVASVESGALHWQAYGPGGVVSTAYGMLDVDRLYDAVDGSATTS